MSKSSKKSPSKKHSSALVRKQTALVLTDSQRRILQILATGIEGEEPNVLAGRR
ncbi:hypothetical protein T3H00_15310 [Pseudomonas fluorescens]|jgi:hypothetical protein|uniref:hypothetical protein n=1 Tax=Pseudomonas TaxID=286 RepID=UPI001A91971E|nr:MULTISPECIES: hypothetical protein [Pseudomonas]MDZ5434027.1 hypothetical protein [Pseudomonas fluorescens]